tara:strand:- start:344 stop:565 length:222 start_codon:yes stop_codon:yes gene_type:complete
MANFGKQIWSQIYHVKKKTFMYPLRDIGSLQKSFTSKGGIVVVLIAATALMAMTQGQWTELGIVFVNLSNKSS